MTFKKNKDTKQIWNQKTDTIWFTLRRDLHRPTVTGYSVENKPRLSHTLTDSQASLSPFKALHMRSALFDLSDSERSGHHRIVSFFSSGLTYRAPKQIVREQSLIKKKIQIQNLQIIDRIIAREYICTYLFVNVDPWIAVPDWKKTNVPVFTVRAPWCCATAVSVTSISLSARPGLMYYKCQPTLTEWVHNWNLVIK